MRTVEKIAEEIVRREGGYVNDPDDPGGATNFGVTIHTMRRLGLDLDGDGDVDAADVRMLTSAHARDIFLKHYFFGPKIDRLPQALHPTVFDMYVNSGSNAVRLLQRVLNDRGRDLSEDGRIGPMTIRAAFAEIGPDQASLVDAYGIARRDYYLSLADRRPASRKYARARSGGKGGWIKRAEEFISPALHMSEDQFQRRVKLWA